MDFERHNHRQIEMLNQRGGRTLSIVDLIQAGTISVPHSSSLLWRQAGPFTALVRRRRSSARRSRRVAGRTQTVFPCQRPVHGPSIRALAASLG
jgi:hypothetical protein